MVYNIKLVIKRFILLIKNFINKFNLDYEYILKLEKTLVNQSRNEPFFNGDIINGSKILTKEIADNINADRCSIWLYNDNKTSIICQQLYVTSENKWYDSIELLKKDFKPYFDSLEIDPIIIANNAESHPSTSCFTENYLKPLGIKSMLDVPIVFRNEIIGVFCIESLKLRKWKKIEINFAQLISSLYSFAHSVYVNNKVNKEMDDLENFVDKSVIITKADNRGKITYINENFSKISGYSLEEVLGKDHNIVNSGFHPKEFWSNMYKTIITDKKIWNNICTNKTKNGELYWVDSFIKAEFDCDGKVIGFMSIRYDVTDLIKKSEEINKKNTYLEHAAKILRHDMHSGINTYIPRGVSSLERRLSSEVIESFKLQPPLKMIKDGLKHTQKVYKGVYEFTNLVKQNVVLSKELVNLKEILHNYLSTTSYYSQVLIDELPTIEVNEPLFCTAIDNLIRNGLKYNDSDTKMVKIYMEDDFNLIIQDNGRGLTQEEFEYLSQPYTRKENQKESGTGLGLNICIAILKEHKFKISCEKNNIGTKIKINIK